MCLFTPKIPKIDPPAPPPATKPLPDKPDPIPQAEPLRDETDVARVQYGTKGKKGSQQARRTGTSSLRIPLNTGSASNASKGGLNV